MALVLFSNYIVCSVRCLSCLPITISLHSPSFTFAPLSPLSALSSSSSSSSNSTPPLNVVSDFLTKECGFLSSQVTTIMRRNPALLRRKCDRIPREAIHLLRDSGFTENELKSVILKNPSMILLKVDRQLKPKMEFLKNLGLSPQDIARMISRIPRFLSLSLENSLAPRVLHLRNLLGSNVLLCKALKVAPQLLTSDHEKQVKPKVAYVKNNMGILEDSAAFVKALDAVLGLRFETLENKTKHMASLGLAEEEIHQIFKSHPFILRSSTTKIKENIDFLIHTAGLTFKIVASNPLLLDFSIEKKLKPRYEVFKDLRTNSHSKDLPSLVTFFKLNERQFLHRFGQFNTQIKSTDHISSKASILEQ